MYSAISSRTSRLTLRSSTLRRSAGSRGWRSCRMRWDTPRTARSHAPSSASPGKPSSRRICTAQPERRSAGWRATSSPPRRACASVGATSRRRRASGATSSAVHLDVSSDCPAPGYSSSVSRSTDAQARPWSDESIPALTCRAPHRENRIRDPRPRSLARPSASKDNHTPAHLGRLTLESSRRHRTCVEKSNVPPKERARAGRRRLTGEGVVAQWKSRAFCRLASVVYEVATRAFDD